MGTVEECKELWEKSRPIIPLAKWDRTRPTKGETLFIGRHKDWRFFIIQCEDRGRTIYDGTMIYKTTIVRLSIENWAQKLFEEVTRLVDGQTST